MSDGSEIEYIDGSGKVFSSLVNDMRVISPRCYMISRQELLVFGFMIQCNYH